MTAFERAVTLVRPHVPSRHRSPCGDTHSIAATQQCEHPVIVREIRLQVFKSVVLALRPSFGRNSVNRSNAVAVLQSPRNNGCSDTPGGAGHNNLQHIVSSLLRSEVE